MKIQRDGHLQRLLSCRHNQMIKVITGMRRCGKSFLLFQLFADALRSEGVDEKHIVKINLEDRRNKRLRNPDELLKYIDSQLRDERMHYILLDEIQLVDEFEDVLNSYLHVPNADVYVTGSNAKFLSKDVITEFRGRGEEIRLCPLSFRELAGVREGISSENILREYMIYGGLPQTACMKTNEERENYLSNLFTHTYIRDIKDRHDIKLDDDLEELICIVASSIGGLINPRKLMNTFQSVKKSSISQATIKKYLEFLQDAFLIERAVRYDIRGKRYIDTPAKYYFEDLGLRNALLNFRQMEEPHLMENLIYNELRMRGMSVDVGEVTVSEVSPQGHSVRKQQEVDFVCNKGYERIYIQSALALSDADKRAQELRPLTTIKDNFLKVVIVGGSQATYKNDDGILILNIFDFLRGVSPF